MNELAVSIVLYKTDSDLLQKCIDCISNSTVASRVTIVDNSPDNRLESICCRFPCHYIHNPGNPGYGAAHNIAIKKSLDAGLKYHLVLNADVNFGIDVFEKIVNFMDNNLMVGQVMPKVLNPDGTIQKLCKLVPSPKDLILRRFVPNGIAVNMRKKFELWDGGYENILFVPYLSGCFMFLRCDSLKNIGIFDERFFMYPEDIDLTRRMASKYETIYFPMVSVVHVHGAESYKSLRMLWIHIFNIFKYFNKWGWFFDAERRRLNNKTLFLIDEQLKNNADCR